MREIFQKVRDFHLKYGFEVDSRDNLGPTTLALSRLHLIQEETAELAAALSTGDAIETLDALADLQYVVLGTAVAFGLPLPEAVEEVHRSNMTKDTIDGRRYHPRKGKGYSPPNLKLILEAYDGKAI